MRHNGGERFGRHTASKCRSSNVLTVCCCAPRRISITRPSRSIAPRTVADLSCGNGAVALALVPDPVLGDLARGYPVYGPIEETIQGKGNQLQWVVDVLRSRQVSWAQIGAALGISRQSAWERFT